MRPTYDAMMGHAKFRIEIELQFKNDKWQHDKFRIKHNINPIQSSKTLQSNQLNLNNSMAAGIDQGLLAPWIVSKSNIPNKQTSNFEI